MQKSTKKKIIGSVVFLGILGAILTVLDLFMFIPIKVTNAYSSFYEEKENSLDLVLIGNSTTMYGFSPSVAYGEKGITSHVIGSQPSHPEVIQLAIKEAYETQHPKAIFVDVNGLTFQTREQQEYYVRNYFDSMPDGERKDKIAERYPYLLTSEQQQFEPFSHHNNFRNYEIYIELDGTIKKLKGHKPTIGIASLGAIPEIDHSKDATTLTEDQQYYVDRFIEVSKQCPNTKIVFGRMPRFLQESTMEDYYALAPAKKQFEDAGFDYIDFSELADQIIEKKDQRDDEHINVGGAIKFSSYLVDYFGLEATPKPKEVADDFADSYNYIRTAYAKYFGNR